MTQDGVDGIREISALILDAVNATIKICQSDPRYPLSFPKGQAIMYLSEHLGDSISISELAKQINLSLGWTSRIAQQLVVDGLIHCTRDGRDRRVLHVTLTEQGMSIARLLSENLQRPISAAVTGAQPKTRAAIAEFLRRFTTELRP